MFGPNRGAGQLVQSPYCRRKWHSRSSSALLNSAASNAADGQMGQGQKPLDSGGRGSLLQLRQLLLVGRRDRRYLGLDRKQAQCLDGFETHGVQYMAVLCLECAHSSLAGKSQPSRFLPSLWASAQTPRSSALSKRAADRPTYTARLLVARTIGEPMRIERAVRAAIREIDPAGSNGQDRPLAAGRPPDSVRCPTRTGARRRRSP